MSQTNLYLQPPKNIAGSYYRGTIDYTWESPDDESSDEYEYLSYWAYFGTGSRIKWTCPYCSESVYQDSVPTRCDYCGRYPGPEWEWDAIGYSNARVYTAGSGPYLYTASNQVEGSSNRLIVASHGNYFSSESDWEPADSIPVVCQVNTDSQYISTASNTQVSFRGKVLKMVRYGTTTTTPYIGYSLTKTCSPSASLNHLSKKLPSNNRVVATSYVSPTQIFQAATAADSGSWNIEQPSANSSSLLSFRGYTNRYTEGLYSSSWYFPWGRMTVDSNYNHRFYANGKLTGLPSAVPDEYVLRITDSLGTRQVSSQTVNFNTYTSSNDYPGVVVLNPTRELVSFFCSTRSLNTYNLTDNSGSVYLFETGIESYFAISGSRLYPVIFRKPTDAVKQSSWVSYTNNSYTNLVDSVSGSVIMIDGCYLPYPWYRS